MRKSSIYADTNRFMLKLLLKAKKHNHRLISLFITMIHSFILACQCIFLNTLVSMHPHKNSSFLSMKILKKGGTNNHDYNNLNADFSYTQSYKLYQTMINKSLGLCFHRNNGNFYIKENFSFEPLIVDSKLPLWYSLISGLNERDKWQLISGMGGNFHRNMHRHNREEEA